MRTTRTVRQVNCENRDRTPRQRRNGTDVHISVPWLPALLIAWGAAALLQQIVGHGVSVIPLTIGILLVAKAQSANHYPLLVVGSVLAGNGAGNLLGDILGHGLDDPLGTFGAAIAFLWLRSTDRERSRWAVVPAIVLAFIGLAQLGDKASTLAAGWGAGWLVPAAVIVAGVLLLGAHRLPKPVRLAGFVFVIAAALSFLSGGDRDRPRQATRDEDAALVPTTSGPRQASLPVLDGRTVFVETTNGSVTVTTSEAGEGMVTGQDVHIQDGSERVTITTKPNTPITVVLPIDAAIHIKAVNGPVILRGSVRSATIETTNGAVQLTVPRDTAIDAESTSGVITVDNSNEGRAYADRGEEGGGEVSITTTNGAIVVTHIKEREERAAA